MSGPVSSIGFFVPVIASNAVFSTRRAGRGVDAIEENPLYAAANFNIATAQVTKGVRAVNKLSQPVPEMMSNINTAIANDGAYGAIKSANKAAKTVSSGTKFVNGVKNVVNFTADHINPAICVTSGIKVLGAEDKEDEAAREVLRVGTMFAGEAGCKRLIGMPYTKKVNGKVQHLKYDNILGDYAKKGYEKIFSNEQKKAIADYCKTKQFMKYAPATAKGLSFVGGSMLSYALGDKIATQLLGPAENKAKVS